MQKKTRFKSPLRDAIVICLCLGTAFSFLYLFWRDLNQTTTRTDKNRIATISFKNRIAQRKFSDRVVWERVNQNSPIYDGDIIRTADLSQATLHFDDGTSLDIYENTMIQIAFSKDGGLQISVDGGDVQVASAAESSVALVLDDGSKVTVDAGASLSAKADASGARSVEVKNGTASVVTETGSAVALVTGESVSVEKGGEIQKKPVTVTSIPKDLRILHIADAGKSAAERAVPVSLAWNVADTLPVTVETSARKDFSELLFSKTVSEKRYELMVPNGSVYWRVYTDEETDLGAQGKITVEPLSALESLAPAEHSEFSYRVHEPRVNFRWNGNKYVTRYALTVSKTPDMRSPVWQTEITDTFASTDSLPEGRYYWQVEPTYTLQHVGKGTSAVHSFAVVRHEKLRPPELSIPADSSRLVRRGELAQVFMWKSDIADARYEVLVSRDKAFTDIAWKAETDKLRLTKTFDTTTLADGSYYWKIVRHAQKESDAADDVTPESAVRTFTLAAYVPQENKLLFPPDAYSAEMVKFTDTAFMWKLGDDAPADSKSVFQIASNADFSVIKVERTLSGTSLSNVLLAPGTYWWRVGLQTADGTVEGLTRSRSFEVLKALGMPVITAPVQSSSVLTWNASPVSVRWNATDGADYYDVRVYGDDGIVAGSKLGVRGTSTALVLPAAHYTVRVQAVSAETATSPLRTGEASLVSFTVREPERIETVQPVQGAHIAGLTALRNKTVFRWHEGIDHAEKPEFVLYKKQNDGSLREVEHISQAVSGLFVERLPQGSYSWRIRGSTRAGFPIDSPLMSFTVDSVPALARPVLQTPPEKFVMDFAWLRKNRTISFSWQPVSGATDYNFTLYKKEAGGVLSPVMTEKQVSATSVTLKKLKLLAVGDFVWTVTASSHAPDGFEEQQGQAATGEFKVSFDKPKKVETIQPERMYAD